MQAGRPARHMHAYCHVDMHAGTVECENTQHHCYKTHTQLMMDRDDTMAASIVHLVMWLTPLHTYADHDHQLHAYMLSGLTYVEASGGIEI
jgi:hypothetical protein